MSIIIAKQALHTALQKNTLFKNLNIIENSFFVFRVYNKKTTISNKINEEPAIGIIIKGSVDVFISSADGPDINVSHLQASDCFGISNIFSGKETTTMLICRTRTQIAYLTRKNFFNLIYKEPEIYERYAVLCNDKIHYLTEKIEFLSIPTCKGRLINFCSKTKNDHNICYIPSKEHLSKILGVSRASLYRELKNLTDCGILQTGKKFIKIVEE